MTRKHWQDFHNLVKYADKRNVTIADLLRYTDRMSSQSRVDALCLACLFGNTCRNVMRLAKALLEDGVSPDMPTQRQFGQKSSMFGQISSPVYSPGDTPLTIISTHWLRHKNDFFGNEAYERGLDRDQAEAAFDEYMLEAGGCSWAEQFEFIKDLVQRGADPEQEDATAMDDASHYGIDDVLRLFQATRHARLMAKWRRVAHKVGRIARFVRICHDAIFRPGGRGTKRAREDFEAAARCQHHVLESGEGPDSSSA